MHRIKCFSTKSILLNIGEAARRALFAICKNRQDIIGKIKMGKCQRLLDTNSRPTVIKYLTMTKPPIASRPCKLDPHIPRIKELILSGHSYMEIFNKIKEEGYTGEISLYNSVERHFI